jgi:BAI1-associated protein 3
LEMHDFVDNFIWFDKSVARWLDIALYKAMQRIIRAVELDDLEPVDEMVKHSSSAVDIRTVLLQIKTFWKQLNWPDVEASYAFISKILDVSLLLLL